MSKEPQKVPPIAFNVDPALKKAVDQLRAMNFMSVAAYMRKLIQDDAARHNIDLTAPVPQKKSD